MDTTGSRRGEVARGEAVLGVMERAPDARTAGIGVPTARRAI